MHRIFATAALTLLLGTLMACTGTPPGVEPVQGFEVERYMGRWYEILRLDHRFERGLSHVTAHYSLREDGRVRVINRGLDEATCSWREAEGTARFRGKADRASLAVSFFFGISGGYHIFALDEEEYRWALVSGPTHGYLWLLAREPELDPELQARLVAKAADVGFPTSDLIQVHHGATDCP